MGRWVGLRVGSAKMMGGWRANGGVLGALRSWGCSRGSSGWAVQGLTSQDEVQELEGHLEAGAGDVGLVGIQGEEGQAAEEGQEASFLSEAAGQVVAVEHTAELRRVRLVLVAISQQGGEDDEGEDLWVWEGEPRALEWSSGSPKLAHPPGPHLWTVGPALPYTLLLPITPLLHPSSGLLPGLPASSLCPQAIPHMAQRCHPIACHSWLPGLPRTKSQPLSLAFEVPRGLCSLPWNFICSLIPASPTLPFCQTSGYLPLNPGAIIQYLAQDT